MAKPEQENLTRESDYTLQILDEVATGRPLTQRDLSQKLGIALGMTNNYLKRLARDGYIEINQAERKRLHYLLTPKGIAERSTLTYRRIKRSYEVFMDGRQKFRQFFEHMEKEGIESVVIFGTSVMAEISVLVLLDTQIRLAAVVDDGRAGERFLGHFIRPAKDLAEIEFDRIIPMGAESVEQVEGLLKLYGIPEEKVSILE